MNERNGSKTDNKTDNRKLKNRPYLLETAFVVALKRSPVRYGLESSHGSKHMLFLHNRNRYPASFLQPLSIYYPVDNPYSRCELIYVSARLCMPDLLPKAWV
ncbi:hypothetical protein SAMN05444682_11610 [Parapedobacter indicus]|uniref:Uncharacterized protein n=1 Tax=Parapedobacter indicus TaxID=1477437 RepID=A0A1I3VC25_9SPHI|nr:hypothetical protein CLV26_11674 [Parapedobacter indicus]SFJ91691.1 hypothetical protein SAMN05444682_11610 [Parapedobacter indicus]